MGPPATLDAYGMLTVWIPPGSRRWKQPTVMITHHSRGAKDAFLPCTTVRGMRCNVPAVTGLPPGRFRQVLFGDSVIQDLLRSTLMISTVLLNVFSPISPLPADHTNSPLLPLSHPVVHTASTPIPTAARLTKPARRPPFKAASLRTGLATWYGKVLNRHRTASGEIFNCDDLTGASNTLPFGTRVNVKNLDNGLSVTIRVNDRGILSPGHIIDLSSAAARQIGLLRSGVAQVSLEVVPAPI